MITEHLFPIPVAVDTIDPSTIDHSLKLVNEFVHSTNFGRGAKNQLLTTFDQDKNFLGLVNDQALITAISERAQEFMGRLGFRQRRCSIEIWSWLQYNQPGSHFARHEHYGALVSGVIYLQAQPNSGNLVFHSPLDARGVTNRVYEKVLDKKTGYVDQWVSYQPKPGRIIMFESWLPHSVETNLSSENRISVSFNIYAGPAGEN